jgi:hypothetical protein
MEFFGTIQPNAQASFLFTFSKVSILRHKQFFDEAEEKK